MQRLLMISAATLILLAVNLSAEEPAAPESEPTDSNSTILLASPEGCCVDVRGEVVFRVVDVDRTDYAAGCPGDILSFTHYPNFSSIW